MSEALVAFLRARLDEDEATAQDSGPALVAWLTYRDDAGKMLYTTVAAGGEGDWDVWVANGKELPAPASTRVVYDPARVLREVEAKRAILDAHGFDAIGKFGSEGPPRCLVCLTDRESYEEFWEGDPWPCLTLRLLAEVYRSHPDYDPSWVALPVN